MESDEAAVLGVSVDITEQKKAQEQIHRLNEELEQRVQARTRELREEIRAAVS